MPLQEYWTVSELAKGIVITCRGHDKERTVSAAVNRFEEVARGRSGDFSIFADLREMTGYESESRQAWQTAFARHRKRVDSLVLIGARSPLIRMGAAAVGAFAGIPVRFVQSWSELPEANAPR
jgi:hypothetical protein